VKVTADTNIYISALYFRGNPLRLLHLALDHEVELATSPAILAETQRVMRDKFHATPADIQQAETLILSCAEMCHTTSKLTVIHDDPCDDRILECAVDSGSGYIVSGDRHLLRLKAYGEIEVVTISELLTILTAH
jgi:putative PIN family toxin of toxin-antitoxin system